MNMSSSSTLYRSRIDFVLNTTTGVDEYIDLNFFIFSWLNGKRCIHLLRHLKICLSFFRWIFVLFFFYSIYPTIIKADLVQNLYSLNRTVLNILLDFIWNSAQTKKKLDSYTPNCRTLQLVQIVFLQNCLKH